MAFERGDLDGVLRDRLTSEPHVLERIDSTVADAYSNAVDSREGETVAATLEAANVPPSRTYSPLTTTPPMSTNPTPGSDADRDPEVSDGEAPQAMRLFTEPDEADVSLDPNNPAFDRVQTEKEVDGEYEREYNRRYVKEHGDHHGHEGKDAKS